MYKTTEDKFYISKTELLEKMVALMGGRAAEKLALNEISTGASNDIEVATGIARRSVPNIVCQIGFASGRCYATFCPIIDFNDTARSISLQVNNAVNQFVTNFQ